MKQSILPLLPSQNSMLNQPSKNAFLFRHPPDRPRPHHSADASFSFLRFPLGAGSILGVYVTVRVTTSRMWRMLVPFFSHRAECCCWGVDVSATAPALAGVGPISYRLAFRAASQSKGLLILLALQGERTAGLSNEPAATTPAPVTGLGGTRRLGKVVGPVAGADSG